MISIREETSTLLDDVEQFARRKLRYHREIALMIELARPAPDAPDARGGQKQVFEDIIFLAKFLWNSYNLMRRIGPADQGYPKLSAEFRDRVEKFSTLIKTLIKEGPDEVKLAFKQEFFAMSQESMNNLMQLSADLSWLKNYTIDTKKPLL